MTKKIGIGRALIGIVWFEKWGMWNVNVGTLFIVDSVLIGCGKNIQQKFVEILAYMKNYSNI